MPDPHDEYKIAGDLKKLIEEGAAFTQPDDLRDLKKLLIKTLAREMAEFEQKDHLRAAKPSPSAGRRNFPRRRLRVRRLRQAFPEEARRERILELLTERKMKKLADVQVKKIIDEHNRY